MAKKVKGLNNVETRDDLSNLLRVLKEIKEAVLDGDTAKLNELSNGTIHSATVSQNPINTIIAVLAYAFSKVFSRDNYQRMEGWDVFRDSLLTNLSLMIVAAERGDSEGVILGAGKIRHSLNSISSRLKFYIKEIFRKAEINKAFKLYEHGLSSEKTAKLLGISLWELASYIGQSNISEARVAITLPEKERVKYVEEFFK
jgi:hypothetical protein